MRLIVRAERESDTAKMGRCLGSCLKPGTNILMSGDLGAGKTTLTKAVAEGLGIDPQNVTSPTFSILHHFPEGNPPLVHVDLYRLGENPDMDEIGIEEYLDGVHILMVEWSEYLGEESPLKQKALLISLTFNGELCRKFDFEFPQELQGIAGCFQKCLEEQGIKYESTGT